MSAQHKRPGAAAYFQRQRDALQNRPRPVEAKPKQKRCLKHHWQPCNENRDDFDCVRCGVSASELEEEVAELHATNEVLSDQLRDTESKLRTTGARVDELMIVQKELIEQRDEAHKRLSIFLQDEEEEPVYSHKEREAEAVGDSCEDGE